MIDGTTKGLRCLSCGSQRLRVVYTRPKPHGVVQRRRECRDCKQRATTWEKMVPAAPIAVPSIECAATGGRVASALSAAEEGGGPLPAGAGQGDDGAKGRQEQ